MAVYDYQCGKCGKKFSVNMSMSEHDTKRTRCPKCKSLRVVQHVSAFFAQTSKKS
ncbi:FmdB family zinc ribbon protein [Verrucomicrobiota bacterium]